MNDNVNHPKHYTQHPSGVECCDISKWLSGCLAQAFQYVWRAGSKADNPKKQDLEKAIFWINKELTIPYDKASTIPFEQTVLLDKVLQHETGYKHDALKAIYFANHFTCFSTERGRSRLLQNAVESIENLIKEGEKQCA